MDLRIEISIFICATEKEGDIPLEQSRGSPNWTPRAYMGSRLPCRLVKVKTKHYRKDDAILQNKLQYKLGYRKREE